MYSKIDYNGFFIERLLSKFRVKKVFYTFPPFYSCGILVAEDVYFYNPEWGRYLNQMKDYTLTVTLINL